MDDYEMDDTELFGLGGLSPDQEAEDAGAAADMGALPFGVSQIQSKYGELLRKYESSNKEVLDQLVKARNRLLNQPTEKSKGEYLRGLVMALTTPTDRSDPRFYERKNLFTFLRDVGEYGAGEEKAAKEAKLKREEELAKIEANIARAKAQSAEQQLSAIGPLYRETIKAKREKTLPANIQEVQYYEAIRDDETQPKARREYAAKMLEKLVRIPSESVREPTWNERIVQAKLRKKQGKATAEDEIIIEMSEKAGSDFLSILNMLSGKKEE